MLLEIMLFLSKRRVFFVAYKRLGLLSEFGRNLFRIWLHAGRCRGMSDESFWGRL